MQLFNSAPTAALWGLPPSSAQAQDRNVDAAAHVAASNERAFANWHVSHGSPDADLNPDLDTMRARVRDLDRNHGVAGGAIATLENNVVGSGPRLSSTPDYRALGKSKEWEGEFSRQVESAFRSWWETRDCDAHGHLSGGLLTRQVFHGALINGSGLVLPLWIPPERGRKWALQLQAVESDRLSNPQDAADTDKLRGGVEINAIGRPVAYHIRTSHPGDRYYLWGQHEQFRWERVAAETEWGRKRVLHVFYPDRAGQNRGKPVLASVVAQFRMLDSYQRTELEAAIMNAVIAAAIETPLDGETAGDLFGVKDPLDKNTQIQLHEKYKSEITRQMKGAMFLNLPVGSKLNAWSPGRPSEQFGPFVESVIRNIAASLNLPYELLMKDFSKTNYSSARAAILEAGRMFVTHREWLKVTFLDEVYALFLEEAISKRVVDMVTLKEYYANRYAYAKAAWIWPGRGWVDPVKEAEGARRRIKNKLSTLQRECGEQGLDYEEVLEQLAKEKKMVDRLELEAEELTPATEQGKEKAAA